MQEQHVYEYAVLRVMPRVERGEFVNVGVVLYCPRQKFLGVLFAVEAERLCALFPALDIEEVRHYLQAFEQVCLGLPRSGPIGRLDPPSRFRWLTATRSTVVQASRVHPGLCSDASAALERLFREQVL